MALLSHTTMLLLSGKSADFGVCGADGEGDFKGPEGTARVAHTPWNDGALLSSRLRAVHMLPKAACLARPQLETVGASSRCAHPEITQLCIA